MMADLRRRFDCLCQPGVGEPPASRTIAISSAWFFAAPPVSA